MDYQLHISAIRTTWSSSKHEYMVYVAETDSWWERGHQDYVESQLKEVFGEVVFFDITHSKDGISNVVYLCGKKHHINIK